MQFFGKEVPADKIVFVTNFISFVLGVIFFIRMYSKLNEKPSVPILYNPEHDSLVAIQTRVNTQLNEIKKIQDSIITAIRRNEQKLSSQTPVITKKRALILSTIRTDWDDLDRVTKDQYINQKLIQIKKQ